MTPLPRPSPPPQHHHNPKTTMPRQPDLTRATDFHSGHRAVPGEPRALLALPASVSPSLRWGLGWPAAPEPRSVAGWGWQNLRPPLEPIPVAPRREAVQRERNSHRAAAFLFLPPVCVYI